MTDFATAETAIRQLHARYGDAVWRRDFEAFGDCFVADAEWRIGGMVLKGREEIVRTFAELMSNFDRVLMNFHTPILQAGVGIASARTFSVEQCTFTNGEGSTAIGVYFEHFVDQGDRWRFSWRLFQLEYLGPPDLSGSFFENPQYGPPPNMPARNAPTFNHAKLSD